MLLDQWANRWGVSHQALSELKQLMGIGEFVPKPPSTANKSEDAVQTMLRINASKAGRRYWRNNVGACKDENGRIIRYGLANESTRVNHSIKSSDLIGITPVVITQDMVGSTVGQFTAIEVKKEDWNPQKKLDDHETSQLKFLILVQSLGGRAHFANKGDMI